MEYSRIEEVNKRLKPMDIKGKAYAGVAQRILGFRELYPNGSIQTEILDIKDGTVLVKATAYDDEGKVIATGHAQEEKTSSYINKTSYVENCETSAIGRALGVIGIGTTDNLASAEEVETAIENQDAIKADEKARQEILDLYDKAGGTDFEKFLSRYEGGFIQKNYGKIKADLLKVINDKAAKEKK